VDVDGALKEPEADPVPDADPGTLEGLAPMLEASSSGWDAPDGMPVPACGGNVAAEPLALVGDGALTPPVFWLGNDPGASAEVPAEPAVVDEG
jgi:hypothetical protein